MGRLVRVDTELVRRGLARSRTQAQELITAGKVRLDGEVIYKPARQLNPAQALVVKEDPANTYVSRGAHKLIGAFDYLEKRPSGAPVVEGRTCLDAGASTGGFTDVLLRRGASCVYAVDVGYGQLDWSLRSDKRVIVIERTNVKDLNTEIIDNPAGLVVGDLSFISLTSVLPALIRISEDTADLLVMVKPQFEVGKNKLGKNGVVRDPEEHVRAVMKIVDSALNLNLSVLGIAPSPLPGPAGNVEYFVYLTKRDVSGLSREGIVKDCLEAVALGPANAKIEAFREDI